LKHSGVRRSDPFHPAPLRRLKKCAKLISHANRVFRSKAASRKKHFHFPAITCFSPSLFSSDLK
jgi:hypothetical protein